MAKKKKAAKQTAKKSPAKKKAATKTTAVKLAARQCLDPKLRRLIHSAKDKKRLSCDHAAAFIATTPGVTAPQPKDYLKRVLVRLAHDQIPSRFSDLHWSGIVDAIYSVNVPVSRLQQLAEADEVEYVDAGYSLNVMLDTALEETRADEVHQPPAGQTASDGSGVVVGVIDFGLDYTLDDFRNADGSTRVAFLWDQTLTPDAGEQSPVEFGHGVEYTEDDINGALGQADPFTVVRHEPGAASHGTHVAGIAAGNGRSGDQDFPAGDYVGAAPGSQIVFVQPAANDQSTSFTDSVHVAEAIAYIIRRADDLGMPCSINMSLGQNGGSHDGESTVERAIDRLLESPGRCFVSAAGNEHIWRGHAGGILADAESHTLQWRSGGMLPLPGGGVVPAGFGDFTANEMEVWYSSRDSFHVRLEAPDGSASGTVEPGETVLHSFPNGNQAFIDSERFTVLNGDARIYIEVSPGSAPTVASGIWRVVIEADESRVGRFDAWIERDARRASNNFADQSFFVGTDFDGQKTLGTPATSRRGIAVANYSHVSQAANDSSSRGTTRDNRQKPEVAAPGTNIFSSNSMGGRTIDNQVQPMRVSKTGTSMAAPFVTGITALMLERNDRLTAPQIRKMLIASANQLAGLGEFDNAFGFGRVDARAAVDLIDE